ncbi:hypothetical protein AC77_5652 [Escherichia coli 5-366-08_S4_C1]|nr:hypothetical protein AKO63_2602 [Escherichia coli]KEO23084.1 hypothetical protein AC77_3069 [Escherichia coli 5-366-08_S4_C1]KEO30681.1 hypothetical protein AC77_6019 [Escherichia coli 5-366-08_S4_C1]KEO35262.1 hypothetical protein AC77_5652 [Escherichia coli 5-366-08_S4_C1]
MSFFCLSPMQLFVLALQFALLHSGVTDPNTEDGVGGLLIS